MRTGNSGAVSLNNDQLTFTPTYDFRPGETVKISVTAAAQSSSGALAIPRMFQFTAAATGGNGVFSGGSDPGVGTNPYNVSMADVDNDGDLDMVTPTFGASSVSIRLNDGSGAFSNGSTPNVGSQPRGLTMADIDGDGDLDLLTANYNANSASVCFNNGTGLFGSAADYPAGSQPQSITTADIDGDGDLDFLVANGASNNVTVYLNNGAGIFSSAGTVSVGTFPFNISTGDVDNDGDQDLLTANWGTSSNTISVRLNNGTGSFIGGSDPVMNSRPRWLALGDLDGDGDLDLLSANYGSNDASVRFNNGSGTFSGGLDYAAGNSPSSIVAADIDGDNDLDMLVSNFFSNNVTVRLNNGNGTFNTSSSVTVGTNPNGIAAADVDNDGDLDLLTANFASSNVSVRFNYVLPDLVVSTPQNVSGTYRNVTVTGPATGGAGTGTLTGSLTVVGTLTIQNGGTLLTACQPLVGTGNFVLEPGGTLGICDPAGIAPTGSTGAVQLMGTRSFSNDASYIYNGTAAQVTGPALPSQVRNLITTNANAVTLTAPETVMQVLTVGAAGNLVLNGQVLTLPSAATGTALVVNSGTGTVQGATALVQRYIDPTGNAGPGYRHYSAPVAATTVTDLTTSGFSPVLNAAYNTSARPDLVTPFPTVYGYDQSRLATTTNNSSAFDKGWASPSGTGDALAVGLGYTVNIAASEKVDFTGTLNNGDRTVPLARNSGATAADAGWALVGNPYPAPLDWDQVAAIDRSNLDGAMYVFESSSQYNGTYRAYTNGVGGGNPLIGSSQGFFVRVSTGQTAGSLTFRNNQRVTSYGRQVPFRRGTTDTRPLVQLQLKGTTGPADALFVYAESGATAGLDSQFDAVKLPNSTGLNLAAVSATAPALAIDGRDQFTAATAISLSIGVPAAGTYTLDAEQLLNLPANLTAYLFDAQANQLIDLSQRPSYTFAVTAQQAMQAQASRFQLRFGQAAGPLATSSAKAGVEVALFPNPAHSSFTVTVPTNATGAVAGRATLFNSLGQVVRENISLSAAGTATTIDVTNLAQGVYTLRVLVGATSITKQIVVQ